MSDAIISILEQGLIYGIMALGVYISYTILDFPDLSVDGTFPLGTAVCVSLISIGVNPWLCLLIAFLAGCLAGTVTGIFNVHLKIKNLLCGILTMTALYSINYRIAGASNLFMDMSQPTIFTGAAAWLPVSVSKLAVVAVITLIVKLLMDWYLRTKSGFLLRSVGDNEQLVTTLAKNAGYVKILGLALSNGLVALSGAVNAQYTRQFSVAGGTGTVVMGLAAVIIGAAVFRKVRFVRVTTGVIFGMMIYKACTYAALASGLQAMDTNLVITVLFVIALCINQFLLEKEKKGKVSGRAAD